MTPFFRRYSARNSERGATIVEAAVALPVFILVTLVGLDLLRLSYNVLSVRFVTSRVMRELSIGDMGAGQVLTSVIDYSGNLGIPLEARHIAVCSLANYPCPEGQVIVGDPQQLVVLQVQVPLQGVVFSQLDFLGDALVYRATVIGKMEPQE